MQRIPEPELMTDAAQARAYAEADFEAPNRQFCELVRSRLRIPEEARIVDLGCGPGDIPLELCREHPRWMMTAIDGSAAMLAHARSRAQSLDVGPRITWVEGRIPDASFGRDYDAVLSNSLLHHLPDPAALWNTVRRIASPGAEVAVMDLARPSSRSAARHIVETYSGGEPEVLKHDFFYSLLAAFTPDEVIEQLDRAALDLRVEMVSDRHLFVWGTVKQEES